MTVDNFIPVLWSNKLLERLKKEEIYSQCVNRDYEGEIKQMGDTVRVNTVGPVTISSYTKNTINLTPEVIQGAGEPMTIDQAKYFYFALDDVDKAQISGNVMDMAMDEASYGLRDATDQFLSILIQGGVPSANTLYSGGAVTSATNPLILGNGAGDADAFETLVDLNTKLNQSNTPSGNRWVVIDPGYAALLIKDPRFTSFGTASSMEVARAGATGGPEGTGMTSVLKMLTGFDVYVSNNVPQGGAAVNINTATAPASTTVFTILAGYKGAVSYAEQIPEGQPEAYRLQTGFADAVRGLHLYGGKVFRPAATAAVYVQYNS